MVELARSLYVDPQLYDLLFPTEPFASYYLAEARRAEAGSALELACGSGQLLAPLVDAGISTVGLDAEPEMLAAARDRLADRRVSLIEADMRSFELGMRFDFVFIARNSLLHLHTDEDLVACFGNVRRHLSPAGVFAFDVFNPDPEILARDSARRFPVATVAHPERGEVFVEASVDYDPSDQINRATWYASSATAPDFFAAPLHLRCLFPKDLAPLLEAGGLTLTNRSADFDGTAFGSEASRQVCLARQAS